MSDLLHLVCPNCMAVNRLPALRLKHNPNCGKCHEPIFNAKPLALNSINFNQYIGRNDIPVLVDFWAPWCGPCKTMAPAFSQAASLLEPACRLAKVNTDEVQEIGMQYAIRSIPTLILFKSGREVARHTGVMSAQAIVLWVRAHI